MSRGWASVHVVFRRTRTPGFEGPIEVALRNPEREFQRAASRYGEIWQAAIASQNYQGPYLGRRKQRGVDRLRPAATRALELEERVAKRDRSQGGHSVSPRWPHALATYTS